ncbi:MAG: DUF349 domain-containing protein [Ottowia sp.]|nr:DUF349 domain-containing protein [Ottowia sp.]
MFPFSREPKEPQPEAAAPAPKAAEAHPLDALTGGVFSAATSGERAQRVRDWLASDPTPDQMQEVFKELSSKDKGAAKALREKLEELRRAKGQEAVAAEWEAKAQALLQAARLNIADSLAWQRDAAKAGAPLSREPLASLRVQLVERVKKVEDLQQRVMVQREAAVMLAQRIELLSTKPLADAQTQEAGLASDVEQWRTHARLLLADPQWLSVDVRYPPQLDAAQAQLLAVRDAFVAALAQAGVAAQDKAAPLPSVPVWADELRLARGEAPAAAAAAAATPAGADEAAKPAAKPRVDPEQRSAAQKAVEAGVKLLEQAVAAGHTKNMHSATSALRQSLKAHGRLIDDALEARVHATLVSAGELEGWQRWSADKVREQLVAKAEALLVKRKIKGAGAEHAVAQNARANAATAATEQAGAMEAAQADATQGTAENANADADAPSAIEQNAEANAATAATLAAGQAQDDAAKLVAESADAASAEGQNEAESAAGEAADADAATAEPTADTQANAQANEATAATEQAGLAQDAEAAERASAAAPAPAPVAEPLEAGYELAPTVGGRKLQETIRKLREDWKAADQGGAPNHGLWKRFDRAINAAHKHVDEWLTKVRAEAAEHRAQRQALIDEVKAFGAEHASAGEGTDWKGFNRQIHQFADRWRNAGHLSEKAFSELQGKWKEAIHTAAAPLETAQKHSTTRRQALIAEAESLGAAAQLRIDAVRALQQRWQAEAQAVPLDRKYEQKLWDAFRKPLDEAFNRKGAERERQQSAMSEHDKAVLDAAKALEAANASGDGARIRAAMAALDAATRAQPAPVAPAAATTDSESKPAEAPAESAQAATETEASGEAPAAQDESTEGAAEAPAAAPVAPPKPAKPVIAMRGDDRPGAKRAEPAQQGRGGKFGDRRDGGRPGGPGGRDARGGAGGPGGPGGRFGDRRDGGRFGDRAPREDRGPRLGDAAFRAQRDAVEHAQAQLRKLAAQAHGETLTQLMGAWAARQADQLPSAQDLGRGVGGARAAWVQAVEAAPKGNAAESLLRLEMAADVPTPADQLDARRALQLQLLTRRNDPSPAETWAADTGTVLGTAHDDATARRLQNALKVLMRK